MRSNSLFPRPSFRQYLLAFVFTLLAFTSLRAQMDRTEMIDQIADSGVAILMISSELPELIGSSDRVYVMREGRVVSELEAGPDLTQERVVAYMV